MIVVDHSVEYWHFCTGEKKSLSCEEKMWKILTGPPKEIYQLKVHFLLKDVNWLSPLTHCHCYILFINKQKKSSIQKWAWEEIEGNVPGSKVHRGCKCMGSKASLQLGKELAVLWNSFWWQGVALAISAFRQPTQYISWE